MATATKKYSAGGGEGKPTLDIDAAVELCFEQLDIVKGIMGGFSTEEINQLSAGDRMKWSNTMSNNLMKNDETTDHS